MIDKRVPGLAGGGARDRGEYVELYYATDYGDAHEEVDRAEATRLRDWLTRWLEKDER